MLIKAVVLATILAAVPALARAPGMRFDVPEPFQVGRQNHTAGTLALRHVGVTSSPVALIEIWVDGTCIGALHAIRSTDTVVPRRDEALFDRDEEGRLVMVGFRVAGDPDGTYRFEPEGSLIPGGSTLAAAHTPISHR